MQDHPHPALRWLVLLGALFVFACGIVLGENPDMEWEPQEEEEVEVIEEDFDSRGNFEITDSDIDIEDGSVNWEIHRDGGEQFAYREIPRFRGDVRLTVVGQIDDASNNCAAGAGIGTSPGRGVAVNFGYFGGGCSDGGPVITASGVTLDMEESSACTFTGHWPWISYGRSYTAELTIRGDSAELDVRGVEEAHGDADYSGSYDTLWVGAEGDGDRPSCSGSIDSVTIEPLD